jgi:hypothetical protein
MTSETADDTFAGRWKERLRTVQSAAVAGVVAAVGWSVVLASMLDAPPLDASDAEINEYYLNVTEGLAAADGVELLAVATIGFLWFIGVIRNRVGKAEPKLFGTVFLGSGILFAAVLFAGVAALAAPAVLATETDRVVDPDVAAMARSMARILLGAVAPRIGSVFVFSFSTLALRTGALPRWVLVVSYLAGTFMFVSVTLATLPLYLFPGWVAFVSVVLLLHPPSPDLVGEMSD